MSRKVGFFIYCSTRGIVYKEENRKKGICRLELEGMKADFISYEGERSNRLGDGNKRIMRGMRKVERRSTSVSGFFRIVNMLQVKVLYYFNNLFTISNKGNDVHDRTARWTYQWIYFIDTVNKASPGAAACDVRGEQWISMYMHGLQVRYIFCMDA